MFVVSAAPLTDFERFDPREVVKAAPDFFSRAFGHSLPGRTEHPLASSLDMATICYAFGITNARPGGNGGGASVSHAMVLQGAGTSGFAAVLQTAAAPVVLRAYQAATGGHPFAAALPMENFRAQPIHAFDVGRELELVGENSEIQCSAAFAKDAAYGIAQVHTYAQIFELSGADLLTNDTASLMNLLRGGGVVAAQTETALAVQAIDTAPALSDGPVFDASNTCAQALSAESLGVAVGMLRTQGAAGRPLNLAPRHLVVEPGLEMLARKLIRDADLSGLVQVSTLPGLAAGRWLVMADPELMPSLALFHIRSVPVGFQVQRSFKSNGVGMRVALDAGAGFVGRIGVVKGGA